MDGCTANPMPADKWNRQSENEIAFIPCFSTTSALSDSVNKLKQGDPVPNRGGKSLSFPFDGKPKLFLGGGMDLLVISPNDIYKSCTGTPEHPETVKFLKPFVDSHCNPWKRKQSHKDFSGMLCHLEQHHLGCPGHSATKLLPKVWISSSLALWKIRGQKTQFTMLTARKLGVRKFSSRCCAFFFADHLFFLIFAVFSLPHLTS